ncbi:MAG TPA: 3-oxoacyl-[acyl-carrier-protein] reductase [bacterium]|nr:3-oxoacyl-[acyl-carrier-protein] reductase [bacterium]
MGFLRDHTAMVTGGVRGIGRSIVLEMARRGAGVAVTDINTDGAENLVREIEFLGSSGLIIKADVSDGAQVQNTVDQTLAEFGKIDILVNNAGITRDNLLMRMSEEEWDLVMRVNLRGAFLCTQKVIRPMMKQRKGKIINVSSVIGIMGNAGQANYAASKAGLIGLTRSTAREVASRNIQVNALAPGYIETEMTAHLPQDVKENYVNAIPAKRPGSPEDVARAAAFLASPAADYITGQVLNIDGGLLIA